MIPGGAGPVTVPEESFVAERAPAWQRLSDLASRAGSRRGLDPAAVLEFSRLYREAAADLAVARLRYPALVPRLNDLVSDAFGRLYGARRTRLRAAWRFVRSGFPALVRRHAAVATLSGLLLLVPAGAAYAVGLRSPEEVRRRLPPEFADASRRAPRGPRSLDPVVSGALSTGIFTNNIRVTFLAFSLGITLGLGTAYVLVFNGLLLGALAGLFAAENAHGAFWVLILPHGVLELSCIVLAGMCGLRLGWSVVDPGSLRRATAVARAGREAVAVAVCLVPPLVVAGLVEGYVTPSGLPGWLRIGVGAVVAAAFWAWVVLGGRGRPAPSL